MARADKPHVVVVRGDHISLLLRNAPPPARRLIPAYGAFPWPDVYSNVAVYGHSSALRFTDGGFYPRRQARACRMTVPSQLRVSFPHGYARRMRCIPTPPT
ncbi:hypothetical protein NXV96_22670 [Bacteroides fragilis]|nr:hypothetical protein [Bacteroides fragilis]